MKEIARSENLFHVERCVMRVIDLDRWLEGDVRRDLDSSEGSQPVWILDPLTHHLKAMIAQHHFIRLH